MSKLITRNEGDNAFMVEQSLLERRDALDREYWNLHKKIGENPYDSPADQISDIKSLGRIADAMDFISKALGAIQQIPRS